MSKTEFYKSKDMQNMDRFNFRAWSGKKMYYTWNYLTSAEGMGICLIDWLANQLNVMQCTSLKDKNGKLIYEGDIFEEWYEDENGEIVYDKENLDVVIYQDAMFQVASNYNTKNQYQSPLIEDEKLSYIKKNQINAVVIGNIFENPELVKN